jgi:hypothetical protein
MVHLDPGGAPMANSQSFDPKLSVFSSAITLCVPGIINNLEKFRQIHCKKILCYKVDIAQGRPVWRCDQEYGYLVCTHLVGQAFAAIPLVQYWSQVGDLLSGFVQNPYSIIGYAVDLTCKIVRECSSRGCQTTALVCTVLEWASTLANIIADLVESTGDRFDMAGFDLCEEAMKDEPDYANIKPPTPATGTAAAAGG